ncbi:ABC transporter permease subunit [Mobilicoccus caccae]|uniref:Ribose ABC transporter permease n=1 Tax=Mobilicoccus caccae TaxID=1859295 RepID=A0ABQ6IMG9_9MICO|nr:ribose ABC transporter permease [Mobilicoccus caccae]GMA38387.1 ribose ABC transporter permease [Mobilicoccus caccae]
MSTNVATVDKAASKQDRKDLAYWWDRVGILLVLLVLIALMALVAPNFLTVANGFNVARAVSINAILAAGMTLVILTGGIDLSVGSIVAVSGVGGVLLAIAGVPAVLAVLGGIALGALAGLLNGLLVAWLALPAFIVTLGSMTYLRGAAYSLTDGQPVVASGLNYRGLGNGSIAAIPTPVVTMIVVYALCWFLLERTTFGRHVYAVGGNPEAARLGGINVRSVLLRVYVLAGAAAGLAGVIFSARVLSAQPTAGQAYELDAIAAVVLGGTALAGGVDGSSAPSSAP